MKRILYGLLILLAIFFIFKGCENRQSKKATISKEEVERKEKEHLEDIYRRDAVLLSLKYKVGEDKVFNILVNENDLTYKGEEKFLDFFDNYIRKARQRIEEYSTKYDIPTDIVASILIDYELMQSKSSD